MSDCPNNLFDDKKHKYILARTPSSLWRESKALAIYCEWCGYVKWVKK
jgi:hypothetical protein